MLIVLFNLNIGSVNFINIINCEYIRQYCTYHMRYGKIPYAKLKKYLTWIYFTFDYEDVIKEFILFAVLD